MARYTTPEARAEARDKAEAIGQAESIVRAEIRDWAMRVVSHRATPAVAIALFFGLVILAHGLVESINL